MSTPKKEIEDWKKFVKENGVKSIDIPYAVTVAAVTVSGIFHLRDPFEECSTEGVVFGAIIGSYNIDRNETRAKMYDPTGNILRLIIEMNFTGKELRARVDTRRWDGTWNEGSWLILWRG
jgi:hypothetical protein